VIIGGTSGFGLATAEWLAGRGATSLVLVSRSGSPSDESIPKIAALRQRGVRVDVASVDVADAEALEQLLRTVGEDRPIKGIIHAAMVLDDRLIEGQDRESIDAVLRPKVSGALNLERLAPQLPLDYLLFYSSATTLFGNPGQFNYVAANAYIEGLARRMRSRGLPALAVAWGGIEDAGYLSRHIGADINLKRRFAANLISARTALDGLDWVFDQDSRQLTTVAAIARIDWATAKRELAATRTPLFGSVGMRISSRQVMDAAATLEKLRALPTEEAAAALVDIVVEEIARVLRLPPKEVDRHRPLAEIGMDSLMMLELRTTVEITLQIELPMMSLATGITPVDVARRILPLITGEAQRHNVPGTLVALSASTLRPRPKQRRARAAGRGQRGARARPRTGGAAMTAYDRREAQQTVDRIRHALEHPPGEAARRRAPAQPAAPHQARLETELTALPEYEVLKIKRAVGDIAGIDNPFYRLHDGRACEVTSMGGRTVVNFSSYDYLGLNGHPAVADAAKRAIDLFGTSVSASRISAGERQVHRDLELALARLHGTEAALAFVSGHATNVSVIGGLLGPEDLVVTDAVIHNSVLDGIKLAGAKRILCPHGDIESFDRALRLNRARYRRALVVVEGSTAWTATSWTLPL